MAGLWSCSGASAGGGADDTGAQQDSGDHQEIIGDARLDTPTLDVPSDVDGRDLSDTTTCLPGAGMLGCPCDENSDCLSSWCVRHMGDRVCTQACDHDCPTGWTCEQAPGTDLTYVCVSRFAHLCLPCVDSGDCQSPGGAQDACLSYQNASGDESGRYCGASCGDLSPCPDGYTCQDGQTWDSVPIRQCIAKEGVCACSELATALALSTVCTHTNTAGTCPGHRACVSGQLTPCDAPLPATEDCANMIDDDCDGATDWADVACEKCVCGDGLCDTQVCGEAWDDQLKSCAADCAVCGDGGCDPGESPVTCVDDCCGTCGDQLCKGGECGESPATCPQDCAAWHCGDGTCDPGEDAVDCPLDCAPLNCGNHTCEPTEDALSCPGDCDEACGDCECAGGESYGSCPVDCGACGDGYCIDNCSYLHAETPLSCPADCCQPDCEGKQCGGDGCGGSCGVCPSEDPCASLCVGFTCSPNWDAISEERCDYKDNNCDGLTDEGFDVGGACDSNDTDQCANGTFVCRPDLQGVVCVDEAVEDIPEACDTAADDDCDGMVNEGCAPASVSWVTSTAMGPSFTLGQEGPSGTTTSADGWRVDLGFWPAAVGE